jgi:16S rRNA (guanine966-N2)-methyltransferase
MVVLCGGTRRLGSLDRVRTAAEEFAVTRIIGGVAGGRPIRTPPGDATRPTADRVREALFSSLESTLGTLHGTTFLDVFAGSGAVGLEAASRGASWVTFVERGRAAAGLIGANAKALGFTDVDVMSAPASVLSTAVPRRRFDVVYLDPPYDMSTPVLAKVLTALADGGWLRPGALLVVERSRRSDAWIWPAGFRAVRDRRYGDTVLWYGRWEPPGGGGVSASRIRGAEHEES